ncbi:MAG: DnaD domain protein [Clostridia bacterium]|nr:DnaD domain protein [Clostridia bacterium]
MFEISPKVYSSMFSLPTEIADRGLKFASGEQLKVIIAIFRNPQITTEEITKITNLSLGTVNECVEYWVANGILKDTQPERVIKTESQVQKAEKVKMPLPEIHFTNPTQAEIEKILKKNGSMKRLFLEAQEILGKTLGYSMQCTIYSIVNRYGITPDVANCLLYFAKSIDNTSQNDILKIAKYWAENGITDMQSADDYIQETEKALITFRELAVRTKNDTSTPTFAVLELFCEWIRWGYGIDEIEKAFNIMKAEKQTGRLVWNNIAHMNGTIKNWRKQGMSTLEEIEKGTKKFQSKSQKTTKEKETSFDVERAQEMAKEHRKSFGAKKTKKGRGA